VAHGAREGGYPLVTKPGIVSCIAVTALAVAALLWFFRKLFR
jgi:hypothetical protein